MKKHTQMIRKVSIRALVSTIFFFVLMSSSALTLFSSSQAYAQSQIPDRENPNSRGFRIVICDGPEGLGHINPATGGTDLTKNPDGTFKYKLDPNYTPCDFKGIMKQVQHIINLMFIVGVLAAIVMTTFAGYLYITGSQENIKRAKSIFPKLAGGFALMLTAWFIVYQILHWLTGNGTGFSSILGNP
jgi:hypothetical protein